jgi:hypothetical protein
MKFFLAMTLAVTLLALPGAVAANMSYSPWVHELVQKGADIEITVQIFDETTATNGDGEPLPGLDAKYTLKRGGTALFEERIFEPEAADEVIELTCHSWDPHIEWDAGCGEESACEDCDSDGEGECAGFCGVAYRYKVLDHCPKDDRGLMYWMYVTPAYDLQFEGEGLGFTNWGSFDEEEAGGECKAASDSGCSVTGVGRWDGDSQWLRLALAMVFSPLLR